MNNEKKDNLYHISIEELAGSSGSEIREDLSDGELNGITGGTGEIIEVARLSEFGCPTCRSGFDPRFEDKTPKHR
jgi:hypothetical protein